MKKKDVLITLNTITYQDNKKDETELFTKARYYKKNDTIVIEYDDTSATGFEGSVTSVNVIKNEYVTVTRVGTSNSNLALEMDKKHFCHYATPYGSFQIGVYTHKIENNLESDGKLYLKYSLDLNSSHLSDNEIIIQIQNFNQV